MQGAGNMPGTDEHQERLSKIEIEQAEHRAMLGGIVQSVDRLATSVEKLDAHVQAAGKSDWGVIFRGGSLIVAVMVALGAIYVQPMRIEALSNKERIDRLDTTVQRELKTITSTMDSRLQNLDTVLQREVRLLLDRRDLDIEHTNQMLAMMQHDIEELEETNFSQDDYDRLVVPITEDIDTINERLAGVRETRFTAEDGNAIQQQVNSLQARIGELMSRKR